METRSKILNSARKEFLAKGYNNASLRKIAANLNMTTGAIYGYFKDKNELFDEVTKIEIEKLKRLLEKFNKASLHRPQDALEFLKRFPYDEQVQKQMIESNLDYYRFMYENREFFVILNSPIKGIMYKKYFEEFIELDYKDSLELLELLYGEENVSIYTKYTLRLLIKSSMESIMEIFREFETFEQARPYLEIYIRLYTTAFTEFLDK
ncbi:MAG: TetR/AcrR family transcriptional regulator [Tissierellia bacterium]|nr:TetR/AcrR family transcriptional regulator [Tissierellia bacterium]